MKRIALTLLVLSMIIALIGGCAQDPSSTTSGGTTSGTTTTAPSQATSGTTQAEVYEENGLPKDVPVTLKVLVSDQGAGTGSWDLTMAKFEERFPNVTFDKTVAVDTKTLMTTMLAANDDEAMFNIFPSGAFANHQDLIATGKLAINDEIWDYTPYDTPDKTFRELVGDSTYYGSFQVGWPDGEKHVGIFPIHGSDIGGLFFNKALFREKDWNMSPQTYDEFVALCEEISAEGIYPIVSSGVYPDYFDMAFGAKAFELADEAGKIDDFRENYANVGLPFFENEFYLAMHEKVEELSKYFHPGLPALNHTQMQMELLNGNAALCCTCSWVGNEMKDATPEGFEWGYMAVPLKESSDTPFYLFTYGSRGNYIWGAKDDLEVAWSREVCRSEWDLDIQVEIAKGGLSPTLRNDYSADPARIEILPEYTAALLSVLNEIEYNLQPLNQHDVALTAPEFSQAKKQYQDNLPLMEVGEIDYRDVLAECDELIAKAKNAG